MDMGLASSSLGVSEASSSERAMLTMESVCARRSTTDCTDCTGEGGIGVESSGSDILVSTRAVMAMCEEIRDVTTGGTPSLAIN